MPRIRFFESNALVQLVNDDRDEERLGLQRGRENLIVTSAISAHFVKFAGWRPITYSSVDLTFPSSLYVERVRPAKIKGHSLSLSLFSLSLRCALRVFLSFVLSLAENDPVNWQTFHLFSWFFFIDENNFYWHTLLPSISFSSYGTLLVYLLFAPRSEGWKVKLFCIAL